MSKACTIGIDIGSSAIKGALVSEDGALLDVITRPTELEKDNASVVVFSSDRCYEILCDVLQSLARTAQGQHITAVSLSGATGDTLLLGKSGRPLLPTIHWMDTRSIDDPAIDPPGMTADDVYRVCGWPWLRMYPLAHLAWLKTRRGPVYKQADKIGMNLTYQYYRLCGNWAMDPSTATTFYLQDQQHQSWHQPYLDWLGLNANQLPGLKPSGTCIGRITNRSSSETGLPEGCAVVLGAFDHPSAARGAGVIKPGDLLLSLGTSWVGFYPVKDRSVALGQKMLIDPFLSGNGGPWGAMFSLTKSGEKLNEALLSSYPDALHAAARYEHIETDLRQTMQGASPSCPAVTLVYELIQTMREKIIGFSLQGIATERIVLVGGPSANKAIVDLFKQILNKPLEVAPSSGHTGAAGAAKLAIQGSFS